MTAVDKSDARIVAVAGKRCRVELSDGSRVETVPRGRLFETESHNLLVVGDHVSVSSTGGAWTLDSVHARRNEFLRQGLRRDRQVLFANVDRVLILASLANPRTKPASVDRFLVSALQSEIPPVLILTKTDLDENGQRQVEMKSLYESFHLPVFTVCNSTGEGVAEIAAMVTEGTSAVLGNSGVGKSSLLNSLVPDAELLVDEVSAWSGKGTHVTTAALMIPYRGPGVRPGTSASLIDTPGMKSFVPFGITRENLAELFPDLSALAPDCRFSDCRHLAEPDCAVARAVMSGRLPESRLRSYQRLFAEIETEY